MLANCFRYVSLPLFTIAWLTLTAGGSFADQEALAPSEASNLSRAVAVPEGIELPSRGLSSHRGANHTHPENTLAAFREAVRVGVHQIELDVYLTDHGDLVVIHDTRVDRTTDGTGDVRRMTLDEIKSLDAGSWKHPRFAGERIPTLDEALRMMPHNIWLNLHLKGGRPLGAAVAQKVLDHGRGYQAFLAAGAEAAAGAREVFPDVLICNMQRQNDWGLYVDQTIEKGDAFIQLLRRSGTPEQMRRLKQAGITINLCCVNDPDVLAGMFQAGVDFPLVDDLHPMMERAVQLGIEPVQPIYLLSDSLHVWNDPHPEWAIVGDVGLDPENPRRLISQPGERILRNGPGGKTADLITRDHWGDVHVRLEFVISERSNSGVKLQGLYEVQILDSWQVEKPTANDCGGIYPRAELRPRYHLIDEGFPPSTNAAKPPGQWQSLEIIFRAPRFDGQGNKTANARFERVALNDQTIHQDVDVAWPTGHAWRNPEVPVGPLLLQGDHGPVAFRNIQVRPLTDRAESAEGVTTNERNENQQDQP